MPAKTSPIVVWVEVGQNTYGWHEDNMVTVYGPGGMYKARFTSVPVLVQNALCEAKKHNKEDNTGEHSAKS